MIKVLFIEDDKTILELYRSEFLKEGFITAEATNAEEGLSKTKSYHPDIILLDLVMPNKGGFDVLERLREDPKLVKIPVVILTNISADVEDLMKSPNVVAYLLKVEYTPDKIVQKVREVLASYQSRHK